MSGATQDLAPADLKTYHGNCHCGNLRFSLRIPELKEVNACDCSYCTKNGILGYIWIREGGSEEFKVELGDEEKDLRVYMFGKRQIMHKFCVACGTNVFARVPGMVAVNARALADVDLETLPRKRWSGREVNGTYVPHFGERMEWEESRKANETEGGQSEEKLGDDFVKYYGNCHCGKVRYAVRWKRLEELKVMNCNCSLCSVNSDLNIYPPRSAVQLHDPHGNLRSYYFVSRGSGHCFCDTCGTFVSIDIVDKSVNIQPMNVRTIEGIELDKLKYQTYDGRAKPPIYKGEKHLKE